ncbi:MAG TPA: hypothetical protein VIB55_14020 [Longimicrobium sp.]
MTRARAIPRTTRPSGVWISACSGVAAGAAHRPFPSTMSPRPDTANASATVNS